MSLLSADGNYLLLSQCYISKIILNIENSVKVLECTCNMSGY